MTNIQAIDLLKGLEQRLDDYCELNDEGKTTFHMAIAALELFGISEQLPSAQPDLSSYSDKLWKAAYERGKAEAQRWIPCGERLPLIEENPVLVSWMGLVNIGWYNPIDGWITGTRFSADEVDAWMPLPEPWKGDYK